MQVITKMSRCLTTCFLLLFAAGPLAAENDTGAVPIASLPETTHVFEPVLEGTQVTHDFILHNKGSAPLEIGKIRTG